VVGEAEFAHLGVGDLASLLVAAPHEVGADPQTGTRRRRADVVDDGLIAVERMAGPVLADLAEQTILDGVPLRGPGGK